jgi:hypothetical protein
MGIDLIPFKYKLITIIKYYLLKYHDLIQIICSEWKMDNMNEMGGETGKVTFSKKLFHTKSWTIP